MRRLVAAQSPASVPPSLEVGTGSDFGTAIAPVVHLPQVACARALQVAHREGCHAVPSSLPSDACWLSSSSSDAGVACFALSGLVPKASTAPCMRANVQARQKTAGGYAFPSTSAGLSDSFRHLRLSSMAEAC